MRSERWTENPEGEGSTPSWPTILRSFMSKIKHRKARPQPPRYYWLDTDNCWPCKNRNNCNGCKVLKNYITEKGKKRDKYAGVAEWLTQRT